MKKTTLAIVMSLVLFLIVFLVYHIVSRKGINTVSPVPNISIIPTQSIMSPPINQFKVSEVAPQNNTTGIAIDSKVIISFDKNVKNEDVGFSIGPTAPFTQELLDNKLIISFNQPLSPGTLYTYTIKYLKSNNFPYTYSFTTTGPTQRFLPNTYPGYVE